MALQRWNKQQAALVANGISTYTFPAISEGYACTCSVSVPGSASGTQWFVYVDGALISSMFGAATCSGIYLAGGDMLTVSAPTPVLAGVAVASGVLGLVGEVPPSSPISGGTPQAMLLLATIAPAQTTAVVTPANWAVGLIVANTVGPVTAQANYALPTLPNTLINLPVLLIEDVFGALIWFIPLAGPLGEVLVTVPAAIATYATISETTVALTETTSVPVYQITVPNPLAGADWSYTLPQPARVVGIQNILNCSATAANRYPFLQDSEIMTSPMAAANITANQEVLMVGRRGDAQAPVAALEATPHGVNVVNFSFPDLGLQPAGYTLNSATTGLAATDQWEYIYLLFQPI
jgi:hypothetical protein